jgi:hypothetical protein
MTSRDRTCFDARADRAREPSDTLQLAAVLVCFALGALIGVIDSVIGRVRYHLWQTRGGMSDAGTRR